MDQSSCPGHRQCIGCRGLVPEKDIRAHILACRAGSPVETKLCTLCNSRVALNEYGNHVSTCHEDVRRPTGSVPEPDANAETEYGEGKLFLICRPGLRNDKDSRLEADTSNQSRKCLEDNGAVSKSFWKHCVFCATNVREPDYEKHLLTCSEQSEQREKVEMQPSYPTENYSDASNRRCRRSADLPNKETKPMANSHPCEGNRKEAHALDRETIKSCPFCGQNVKESHYAAHLSSCPNDVDHSTDWSTEAEMGKKTSPKRIPWQQSTPGPQQQKCCPLCQRELSESDYSNHIDSCCQPVQLLDNRSSDGPSSDKLNEDREATRDRTDRSSPNPSDGDPRKTCVLCDRLIDESSYEQHVISCLDQIEANNRQPQVRRELAAINVPIKSALEKQNPRDCLVPHERLNKVLPDSSASIEAVVERRSAEIPVAIEQKDQAGRLNAAKRKQDCFICFKSVDDEQFQDHVQQCAAQTDQQLSRSSTRTKLECFTCKRSLDVSVGLFRQIPCDYGHSYCLPCLQQSMEDFARNRQTPVCHKTLCDYALSRYDLSLIPLERRLSDRLVRLARGQQRPLCPKCRFYIDLSQYEYVDEHTLNCDELIPCEYCQLPFSFQHLELHSRQCQQDRSSGDEKLADFIMSRSKYPFSKDQIRLFIHEQRKNPGADLDPHSLIAALAVFGPTFPYEMARRECDVCMEARPYEDIYVFDCNDNHKLCYECFYRSCRTKMDSGEVLTCGLCDNPLRDSELNQLRTSDDELQAFRDYQMKKTFDMYSSRTQGIIKCPNQSCRWVAEADDPNQRFRVTCPLCQKEFCSLCNQQYHYRTTCQQLPGITQRWFFWCQTERVNYLAMRAQQDAAYATRLAEYNRRNNENEKRNHDLRRRYEELMNDEKYKEDNCRFCPSCKRVVQRLEGCDSMICGQDAHGGNVQSGCGAKFNWMQAKKYQAAVAKRPKETNLGMSKPDDPLVRHDGVKCDHCQSDVVGIRFDCVHCPSLTFCEKCEQQASLDHATENQLLGHQQHVFRLLIIPAEEASQEFR